MTDNENWLSVGEDVWLCIEKENSDMKEKVIYPTATTLCSEIVWFIWDEQCKMLSK